MKFRRVLAVASFAAIVAAALPSAALAQFGGAPGMPGSGGLGMPGYPGGGGFGGPPVGPPPACQQLMVLRDETQKNGLALKAANERHADPTEACKLFKVFLASESKFVQGMATNQAVCGVPPDAVKNMQEEHRKVTLVKDKVCDAADHPRPTGPTLSDALNSNPVLPDVGNSKSKQGVFDTLQGSSPQ